MIGRNGLSSLVLAALWVVASQVVSSQERERPPLPLEVEFSTPIEGETDVRLDVTIRIQFSREVEEASLANRVRLSYAADESRERGEAQPPGVSFTTQYNRDRHSIEIRPERALERFRQVTVELADGIKGSGDSVLRRWTLTFNTGGH